LKNRGKQEKNESERLAEKPPRPDPGISCAADAMLHETDRGMTCQQKNSIANRNGKQEQKT